MSPQLFHNPISWGMHQGALPYILSGGSPGEEIERRQPDSSLCPPLQAYSTVLSLPSTSEEIRLTIVQDTPGEAPLRVLQFLRRGSALHLCSSSEEVLLYTCAVPPKRFCFKLLQFPRRGSSLHLGSSSWEVLPLIFVQFPPKRVQFHLVLDFGSLKTTYTGVRIAEFLMLF